MKRLLSLVMASFLFLSFLPEIASANSAESLVKTARSYLGVPYSYGGTTTKGIDCSAYTRLVFKESGAASLPRTSSQQYNTGSSVSKSNLKTGDLVFFNTTGRGVSHVGIYVGSNQFIHASVSKGVSFASINDPYYWGKRYIGARRVADLDAQPTVAASAPVKEVVYASRAEVAHEIATALNLKADASDVQFNDVPASHPYYEEIAAVTQAGIFSGFEGNFMPNKELTRAQLAKILVEAFGLQGSAIAKFKDVPADHWAYHYINILYHNKVTTGYGDGTYGLSDKVTAGQLQKFINRLQS